MKYIVVDLEWNQPSNGACKIVNGMRLAGEIIQIGAVMLDDKLNDIADFDAMVRPEHYTVMNSEVAKLTHITQRDIDRGGSFAEVIESFFNWCGDGYVFCTWGPDDERILADNLRIHGLAYPSLPLFIDLQKVFAKQITGTAGQCSLLRALEILREDAYEAHNALNDADNTVTVLWHLDMTADLSDCTSGPGTGNRNDYLRMDSFTVHAGCFRDALADVTLKFFVSPLSGAKVLCSGWVTERPGYVVSAVKGIDGLDYFLSLSMRKRNGNYSARRTVWLMDEEMRARYDSAAAMKQVC